MSWDGYVSNMTEQQKVSQAALLGIDGSVWAQSPEFPLTAEEAVGIAGAMGEVSGEYFRANGCVVGGVKYLTLRFDGEDGLYYGKKGASGICIARSVTGLVLGVYGEGMTAGDCNVCVEGMKDYLVASGY